MLSIDDRGEDLLAPGAADLDLTAPLAHFAEHGYATLGVVASEATLAALRRRADEIMLGEVTYPGLFFQADTATGEYDDLTYGKGWEGPRLDYRKVEKLEKDPLFLAWLQNPVFERVARAIIGDDVTLYRALMMTKGPQGGTYLPWHQDGGNFWGLDRDPQLQLWTALDDAPAEAGCIEVVPGSQKGGLASPLGGVVPKPKVDASDAEERALAVPAKAGEVLLIHNFLWHRSGVNRTDHPRRGFTACFLHGATRCVRKKRAPRVFPKMFAR